MLYWNDLYIDEMFLKCLNLKWNLKIIFWYMNLVWSLYNCIICTAKVRWDVCKTQSQSRLNMWCKWYWNPIYPTSIFLGEKHIWKWKQIMKWNMIGKEKHQHMVYMWYEEYILKYLEYNSLTIMWGIIWKLFLNYTWKFSKKIFITQGHIICGSLTSPSGSPTISKPLGNSPTDSEPRLWPKASHAQHHMPSQHSLSPTT